MAIEHRFYMDTTASQHALRDALIQSGLGFQADDDWATPGGRLCSGAFTQATTVSIRDSTRTEFSRPDNGVIPTRSLCFRDQKAHLTNPKFDGVFERETVLGIMALLKAFPDADAYWLSYDAEIPTLLRRNGRLVLAEALTRDAEAWDAERQPYRALVDLPYVIEPLGPWDEVQVRPPARAG